MPSKVDLRTGDGLTNQWLLPHVSCLILLEVIRLHYHLSVFWSLGLNVLSYVCWLSACSLWRNVCSGLCLLFEWAVCFDAVKYHKLFLNFGDQSLIIWLRSSVVSVLISLLYVSSGRYVRFQNHSVLVGQN